MQTGSKEMAIFEDYKSYEDIPPAKKAWITMKAVKAGKNPEYAHRGIKAEFTKRNGKKKS